MSHLTMRAESANVQASGQYFLIESTVLRSTRTPFLIACGLPLAEVTDASSGWDPGVSGEASKEDPNAPRSRSGSPVGGAARKSNNAPGKKDVPPWRTCPRLRQPLATGNAYPPKHSADAFADRRPMWVNEASDLCRDLARTRTKPGHDTVGRDDGLGAERTGHSSGLAELKADDRSEFASR